MDKLGFAPGALGGRNPAAAACTHHQRAAIRHRLRKLELPTDCITLMHTSAYAAINVPLPRPGMDLNAALCQLTTAQASRLIDTLDDWMEVLL